MFSNFSHHCMCNLISFHFVTIFLQFLDKPTTFKTDKLRRSEGLKENHSFMSFICKNILLWALQYEHKY